VNEQRLAEIEEMAESMEVSARDENIIMELIQALRDERQKVTELQKILYDIHVSMNKYYALITDDK
jgi:hypothetical protein